MRIIDSRSEIVDIPRRPPFGIQRIQSIFFVLTGLAVLGFLLTVIVPRARGPRDVTTTHVEPTQAAAAPAQHTATATRTSVVETG